MSGSGDLGLAGKKVLVVDDDDSILKILAFKLRLKEMVPFEANGAEEAFRIAREESLDVVVLDISLPSGLSGFEICRALKENPATASVPVVMLTARSLPAERDLGMRLGAAAYVTKPFSTAALVEEIRKVLGP